MLRLQIMTFFNVNDSEFISTPAKESQLSLWTLQWFCLAHEYGLCLITSSLTGCSKLWGDLSLPRPMQLPRSMKQNKSKHYLAQDRNIRTKMEYIKIEEGIKIYN
ncbi:hypothetical protein QQ045_005052 [Rhodiola kirilowii]